MQPVKVLPYELEMNGHGVQRVSHLVSHARHEPAQRPRRKLLADGPERFSDAFELLIGWQLDAADFFAAPASSEPLLIT